MSDKTGKLALGRGLDVGTMNLIAARQLGAKIQHKRMRDAFLALDPGAKKMLKLTGADFVERDEELLILGDAALDLANVFGQEARRPLNQGLIAAGEIDALEVLAIMIKSILGEPTEKNEVCCFSVPAPPRDAPDRDIIYHQGVFEQIVEECGYDAIASNEAMAIIYSECAPELFSGLGFSFGSGMTNVALAVNTIEGMTFSVARGGDWIDAGAAKSLGSTRARMCSIKEKGLDLTNPQGREQKALALYYKSLITYAIDQVSKQFKTVQGRFELPKPIPIVLSGGTSLAGGFLEFFTQVFNEQKRFPIEISEIRMASDPLNAVANGLLVQAMQEYAG